MAGVQNGDATGARDAEHREQIVSLAGDAISESLDSTKGGNVKDHAVFRC